MQSLAPQPRKAMGITTLSQLIQNSASEPRGRPRTAMDFFGRRAQVGADFVRPAAPFMYGDRPPRTGLR
jgi:hypothetical protein